MYFYMHLIRLSFNIIFMINNNIITLNLWVPRVKDYYIPIGCTKTCKTTQKMLIIFVIYLKRWYIGTDAASK